MNWRYAWWMKWLPFALALLPLAFLLLAVVSANMLPPCERTEWRSVVVPGGKFTTGGVRRYEVCVAR